MNYITLNNGTKMPQLGFGVYKVSAEETEQAVSNALSVGYRLIDTAQAYGNEAGVGNAIKKSGIKREDIFLVSKIWMSDYGYEKAKAQIDKSLELLQTDYLDLMLLHQPFCDYYGAYRALEEAYKEGKVKAIGVSNFMSTQFMDLATNFEVKPAINQVEAHVFNQKVADQKYMAEFGTTMMAWGPLAQGGDILFKNETLAAVAAAHNKTVAQVALRYMLQRGVVVIPKSTHVERMKENLDVFDFELSADEMELISKLDTGRSPFYDYDNPEVTKMFMSIRNGL